MGELFSHYDKNILIFRKFGKKSCIFLMIFMSVLFAGLVSGPVILYSLYIYSTHVLIRCVCLDDSLYTYVISDLLYFTVYFT